MSSEVKAKVKKLTRIKTVFIVLAIIVVVITGTVVFFLWQHESQCKKNLQKAADFLRYTQFNESLSLCRESLDNSNTYWLVSDNLLAYHALEPYYPHIAKTIYNKMKGYGYLRSYSHEALFGEKVPIPFRTPNNYTVEYGVDYTIKTEIRNGSIMTDYQQYADLVLYATLNAHWMGKKSEAIMNFTIAKSMWDGKGLSDIVTKEEGVYETYKLALLIYVPRILGEPLENKTAIEEILWSMQNATNGGIHTKYDNNFNIRGSPNTETTSLAIIAYNYAPHGNKEIHVGAFGIYDMVMIFQSVIGRDKATPRLNLGSKGKGG